MRESFFMLRVRDLEGGGKTKESESEVADERVEAGAEGSLKSRAILRFCAGVFMRREPGGPFFFGMADLKADMGRGVAVSMF